MPTAKGFTIVEVLVALLVLSVGLLGTISTFGSVARLFHDGHSSVQSSALATQLLEQVRVGGCGSPTTGSRNSGTVSYTWEVEVLGAELRLATVVVSTASTRARADTFSALIPC